jgi:hypothetical protein
MKIGGLLIILLYQEIKKNKIKKRNLIESIIDEQKKKKGVG